MSFTDTVKQTTPVDTGYTYQLSDFFDRDPKRLLAIAVRVRRRIATIVNRATEKDKDGKEHLTDNYIALPDDDLHALCHFIANQLLNKPVIGSKDLRYKQRMSMNNAEMRHALGTLQADICWAVLSAMVQLGELWYDHSRGVWQFTQSLMDEGTFRQHLPKHDPFFNDRHYHGRPHDQTKRRGIPAGTSVGTGKNSASMFQ